MSTIPLFANKKTTSEVTLPTSWTGRKSLASMAQAIRVFESNRHIGLPKTKTRGDVALTTKKMFAQKHTGNARHGAASAPIFVGGGVTHGPKGERRILYISKQINKVALNTAISLKVAAKKVGAIELSSLSKTKEAASVISQTGATKVLVAISKDNWNKSLVFRNIKNIVVTPVDSLNAYEVTKAQYVLFDGSLFSTKKESTKKEVKVKTTKKTDTKKKVTKKTK